MAQEDEEEVVILASDDEDDSDEITPLEIEGEDEDPIDEELSRLEEQKKIEEKKKQKKLKKIALVLSSVLFLLFVILIVIVIVSLNKKNTIPPKTTNIIKKIQQKTDITRFSPSKIDKMLQRANILYEKGNKVEALNIYKDIASYNEAISQYNIGVANMKEGRYEDALIAFKNAILNKEKRAVSAINGAICALKMKDKKLFEYYLDLAYAYLPEESNSALYSYYLGLVNYYRGDYFEALVAFSHPTSKHYEARQEYLASKIAAFLDLPFEALSFIQSQKDYDDKLALGLLYAKIGEYKLAQKTLNEAIANLKNASTASMALSLVNFKLGEFKSASKIIKNQLEQNETLAKNTFPIITTLNKSLFNVNLAQNEYKKNIFFDKPKQYALLFYFAPYKIFNVKETVGLIRKGGLNVFSDDIGSGLEYLQTSSTIAKINESMSEAIKKALAYHYIQANNQLQELVKIYPKHSILHYNLALSYAQLGNYSLSYKHFLSSFRLDSKNYLAGIFAVMSSELMGKTNSKLLEELKNDIDEDKRLQKVNFFMTLTHLIENNQLSMNRWLEEDKIDSPLHVIFDIITANIVQNEAIYQERMDILKKLFPNDIMAKVLYLNAKHGGSNMKEFAQKVQMEFNQDNLDMAAFYYGSSLVKEQYVKMLQISGLVYKKKSELKERLKTEQEDVVGIMQALAYLDLYTNDFEESFTIYNSLIDDHKQQDTNTLFYAAIASVGAKHPENAIALLELSKLIDANNLESRYGLALLYHEMKNLEGAIIQYDQIGDSGFGSKYFDFEIVD